LPLRETMVANGSNFPFRGEGGKVRGRRTLVVAARSGGGPFII